MIWAFIAVAYIVVGLVAAGFMLATFPPLKGYRPPLGWIVLAVLAYVVFWPFLGMMGLGYVVGQWYNRPAPLQSSVVRGRKRNRELYRAMYEETPN